VKLSLDDFGTGYSSLSYLKRFPIDAVKLDQSFVKDITTNTDDAAIAGAVVAMAHNMKLRVVAEGVETLEQLEFLHSLSCDEMQGYFISRPVPADECEILLRRDCEAQHRIRLRAA
jgi:EAL domain-containing protein (putative c-di-GMP-specific phosphodiesterase class I)